jgi:hypothetical protein
VGEGWEGVKGMIVCRPARWMTSDVNGADCVARRSRTTRGMFARAAHDKASNNMHMRSSMSCLFGSFVAALPVVFLHNPGTHHFQSGRISRLYTLAALVLRDLC